MSGRAVPAWPLTSISMRSRWRRRGRLLRGAREAHGAFGGGGEGEGALPGAIAGDDARASLVRDVAVGPVDHHGDAVPEIDQVPDVDEQPREPGEEPAHPELARLRD